MPLAAFLGDQIRQLNAEWPADVAAYLWRLIEAKPADRSQKAVTR